VKPKSGTTGIAAACDEAAIVVQAKSDKSALFIFSPKYLRTGVPSSRRTRLQLLAISGKTPR
jgi:hypothetical protein